MRVGDLSSGVCSADLDQLGRAKRIDDAAGRYIEFCKGTFGEKNLDGLKLVVDCANGAAYRVGPAIFEELGADVTVIGDHPNGLNINAGCGSTHLDALKVAVQRSGAALGIALDGDADRCLLVDADGNVVDRSEEHTSELQSLMRISYAVFCLKKKKQHIIHKHVISIYILDTYRKNSNESR